MTELVSIHRRSPGTTSQPNGGWLASYDRMLGLRTATPKHPLIISASELRDFLRCRVRWWWRYQCRLEPIGGKEALSMGSLVHEITEAWYSLSPGMRTQLAMKKITRRAIRATRLEALDSSARELIEAMCIGYAVWARTPNDDDNHDAGIGLIECFPEDPFELPLTPDGSILVRGRIDNRFKPHKRVMAMQELKTAGQFRDKGLETLIQLSTYLWAMRVKYPKNDRYIAYYTEMRKQLPTERVRAPLFQRQEIERTAEEVDQWVLDTQRAAMDMLDAAIYPNPNQNCSWDCDFQTPCLLRGTDDLEHVLSSAYRIKPPRDK